MHPSQSSMRNRYGALYVLWSEYVPFCTYKARCSAVCCVYGRRLSTYFCLPFFSFSSIPSILFFLSFSLSLKKIILPPLPSPLQSYLQRCIVRAAAVLTGVKGRRSACRDDPGVLCCSLYSLSSAVLCCAVLFCTILNYTMLYCTILSTLLSPTHLHPFSPFTFPSFSSISAP